MKQVFSHISWYLIIFYCNAICTEFCISFQFGNLLCGKYYCNAKLINLPIMRNYYICMLQESQPMRIAIMDDDAVFIDIQFCIRRLDTSSTLQNIIRLLDCHYNSITCTRTDSLLIVHYHLRIIYILSLIHI